MLLLKCDISTQWENALGKHRHNVKRLDQCRMTTNIQDLFFSFSFLKKRREWKKNVQYLQHTIKWAQTVGQCSSPVKKQKQKKNKFQIYIFKAISLVLHSYNLYSSSKLTLCHIELSKCLCLYLTQIQNVFYLESKCSNMLYFIESFRCWQCSENYLSNLSDKILFIFLSGEGAGGFLVY